MYYNGMKGKGVLVLLASLSVISACAPPSSYTVKLGGAISQYITVIDHRPPEQKAFRTSSEGLNRRLYGDENFDRPIPLIVRERLSAMEALAHRPLTIRLLSFEIGVRTDPGPGHSAVADNTAAMYGAAGALMSGFLGSVANPNATGYVDGHMKVEVDGEMFEAKDFGMGKTTKLDDIVPETILQTIDRVGEKIVEWLKGRI
jgi:hypothetical protein